MVDAGGRVVMASSWQNFFNSLGAPATAFEPVTVGASPFSYTASESGFLMVTGGTVTAIHILRGALSILVTGGVVPLAPNDVAVVTYTVLPTINFVPT